MDFHQIFSMKRVIILYFLFYLPYLSYSQFGESIRTGRPGQAIGGFTLGKKVFQIQTGYSYNRIGNKGNESHINTNSTVLRIGLLEHFELSGVINWQSDRIEMANDTSYIGGLSNTQIGARINFTQNKGWLPTIGLQGRLLLRAQSEPYRRNRLGSTLILATGNSITNDLSIGTNWGITWDGDRNSAQASYILNLSYGINQRMGTFVEIYGNLNQFTTNFDTGIYFLVNNDFQLDASVGWQGRNGVPDWFTDVGISWRLVWREKRL